jgi:uncharacterized protein YecT (DUF1311 family)
MNISYKYQILFVEILINLLIIFIPSISRTQSNDEDIIKEIAMRENLSVVEVRADWYEGCSSGAGARMSRCAHFHFLASDIELNSTYKTLMEKLITERSKTGLIKAQRTWLAFRDATCEYENVGWENGTGWGGVFNSCLNNLTKERTLKLKEYLSCNDNGCPE